MNEYHHLINSQAYLLFYNTVTAVYYIGENGYGESGQLSIFTLLKHLMMFLSIFEGFMFYTLL